MHTEMENSVSSSVTYDMPEEVLSYFGSRNQTSPASVPTGSVRMSSDRATPACYHGAKHREHQRTPSQASTLSDVAPLSSLAERFQRYIVGARQPRSERGSFKERASEPAMSHVEQARTHDAAAAAYMPPSSSASQSSSVRRRQLPVESKRSSQPASLHGQPTGHDDFYSSDGRASESGVPTRRAAHTLDVAAMSASQNSYEQPRGDRHAPMRKAPHERRSAGSRHTVSESIASVSSDEESAQAAQPRAAQQQQAAVGSVTPRQQPVAPPARHPANEPRVDRQHHASEKTPSGIRQEHDQMRDDEENCTFQPHAHNPSHLQSGNVHESPYRGSEGTNPFRGSYKGREQDLYERLYSDAEAARLGSEGLRAQREVDETESERNAAEGHRGASANRRQTAGDRHVDAEQVFSRLYLDAQRYHKEKADRERIIEQRRQEERADGPYDWNKGTEPTETEEGDEKAATKRSESAARLKDAPVPAIFLRLSRPSTVTVKFEKVKEQAEKEKREKEQRDEEQQRQDMKKIAGYKWGIPAKSFTFADMEAQNLLYAS